MYYYLKSESDQEDGSILSTCNYGKSFPGYMDQILKIILDPNLINCQLTIGDFEFDVQHLRTLLK